MSEQASLDLESTTEIPSEISADGAAEHWSPSPGVLLRECFPNLRSIVLAFLVCVVAPISMVAVHIHENPMFSPQDEAVHYDYVNRIAQGEMPRLGDRMLVSTMKTISCRGIAYPGIKLPPCGASHVTASEYPGGGYQYEAQEPPTYYAVTAVVRWLPEHILGLGEVTATRSVGALWLSFGLILLWMAGRLMRLDARLLAIGILLLASAPVTLYESSIVANDAAAIPCGAAMAAIGAYVWRTKTRRAPVMLGLGAFLTTAVQLTDGFPAVGLAIGFALLAYSPTANRARHGARSKWLPRSPERAIWALALIVGVIVAGVGWQIAFHDLSIINPKVLPTFAFIRKGPIGLSLIANEALNLLEPLTQGFTAFRSNASTTSAVSFTSANLQAVFSTLLEFVVIAGAAAGLFVGTRRWHHWLGLISFPVLYLGGIVVGVGFWRTYGANPGLIGRYGLAMGPFLVLVLVAALKGRWVQAGVGVFAVASFAVSFYFMLAS